MKKSIIALSKKRGFLEGLGIKGELEIKEIRKGKVNYIFKLDDVKGKVTYILKKSDIYVSGLKSPIISKFEISVNRNYIEAKVLRYIYENISPKYVPKVIQIDKTESYFVMEYLDGYKDIRDIFIDMSKPKEFASKVSNMLVEIYTNTAMVEEVLLGISDRCMLNILIMILFKMPYEKSVIKSNNTLIDTEYFVKETKDAKLYDHLARLIKRLVNEKEALLNGDLHLGSICYKNSEYKIYDFEFAFKGPIGYEVGKVIAHLILVYYYALSNNNIYFSKEILGEISKFYDEIIINLEKSNIFKIDQTKQDIMQYCGVELISRITGVLQLKYITNIKDEVKNEIQKLVFDLGKKMIKCETDITTGKELCEYVYNKK